MLSDQTRRTLCRWVFLCGCLLPTGGLLAWNAAERGVDAEALRLELCRALELDVAFDRCSQPAPDVWALSGLALHDPESGTLLFSCREVTCTLAEQGWIVEARQPLLDLRTPALWRPVLSRLLRQTAGWNWPKVRLLDCELTLELSAQQRMTVTEVFASFDPGAVQSKLALKFRSEEGASAERCEWIVERDRAGSAPATRWALNTHGAAISCSLLQPWLPAAGWLGPQAEFTGHARFEERSGVWGGQLQGRLREISLDRLFAGHFPHQLTGTAEVELEQAIVQENRLIRTSGRLTAGPGEIGRTLLDAAAQELDISTQVDLAALPALAPYAVLELAFELTPDGLQLSGLAPVRNNRAALIGPANEVLWGQPRADVQPVAGLLRTLAPPSSVLVPASLETHWLMACLPLDDVQRTATAPEGAMPRARIRFDDAGD